MHKENNTTSRNTFLKRASLTLVSLFGLGIGGLNNEKLKMPSEKIFKTISDNDANDIIRNMSSPKAKKIKPEPPSGNTQTIEV